MSRIGSHAPRIPPSVAAGASSHSSSPKTHAAGAAHPQHANTAHDDSAHLPHADHAHEFRHAIRPRRPPAKSAGKAAAKGRRRAGRAGELGGTDWDDEDEGYGSDRVAGAGGPGGGGGGASGGSEEQAGEERERQARIDAPESLAAAGRKHLGGDGRVDTAYARNRYLRGLFKMLGEPACAGDVGARILELDLQLILATLQAPRIDRGGLERVRAVLLAHAPPGREGTPRATPDSKEGRLNCIAVMKVLNLMRVRTLEQRMQTTAQLKIRQRPRRP